MGNLSKKMRPQSSLTAQNTVSSNRNLPTVKRPETAGGTFRPGTGLDETEKKERKQWLKDDMIKKKNKEKYEDKLVEIAINKIKNEKAYEYLIKMGEANEICQTLGQNKTYRVFNSADGSIRCHIYENDQYIKSLNLDEFEREYKNLKNTFYKKQKLKIWEVLNDKAKSKNKNLISNQSLSQERQIQEKGTTIKKERNKTLKKQLAILKKKGINNQMIPPQQKKDIY